ncbi:MAG: RDD family protein [Gemmatimonadetes bacterium]|nr:RDD family protein [Gemmatimonadota bacterium]
MMIDLLLVACLVHAGGGVLFGLAAAVVFFRVARRTEAGRFLPRSVRAGFAVLGALVLFSVAHSLWGRVTERGEEAAAKKIRAVATLAADGEDEKGASRKVVGNALLAGADLVSLQGAENEQQALERANRFADRLRRQGVAPEGVRDALDGVADVENKPWVASAVRRVMDRTDGAPKVASPDSLASAYAAALHRSDTAAVRALRPRLVGAFAGEPLRRADRKVRQLTDKNAKLQDELEEAKESHGLLDLIGKVADDLGLGFGWTGLYFTAFLAVWGGQTPGKRLLGMRVMRLNGARIGWWAAFERFGGYAASIFTGLLGFAQIFWDHNRQALHDKISETVVVRVQ